LTEANKLFEAGKADEARGRLAAQQAELRKTESASLAAASASSMIAPPRGAKPLERDFDEQVAAVAEAEKSFAKAPAPVAGKATVRANQESALRLMK
jgi:hypothetical protein